MKKGHLVKASLINGQSKNQGSLFYVVASAQKEVPDQKVLAGFKCNSCKATFASVKDFEPHCVVCASENVELDDTLDTPVENVEDSETASIQCTKCNTFNMVSLAGAVAFDNHINCVTCATALSYALPESVIAEMQEDLESDPDAETSESDMEAETAAEETESEMEEESEAEETAAADDDDDFNLDDILDDTDDDDIDNSMEEESEETEEEETAATEESETESEEEEEEETAGADEDETEETQEETTEEETEEETTAGETINKDGSQFDSGVPAGETSDCETKEVVTTTEGDSGNGSVDNGTQFNYDDVPVMDVAPADEQLAFQYSDDGDTITAFKGDFPVADLKREHAGENQKVFANAAFVPSVIKYAKQNSETAALNAFGFKMRTIKVPVDNLVQARVERELAKQTAELASSKDSYNQRLSQSMKIAMAGMNKNFFRGTSNPLMDELVAELAASSSLQAPRAFVNRVFASVGEKYAEVIMAKAEELCSKSDEVRNELAAALGEVNMVDDQDEDEDSVTARLSRGGKTVKAKPTTTVASTSPKVSQISQINERAKELGGLFGK